MIRHAKPRRPHESYIQTAMATLNATTNAEVLAHVKALTFVMGVAPVHALGSRRADAVTFPSGAPRFEEVV